jgi:hypothetical protein
MGDFTVSEVDANLGRSMEIVKWIVVGMTTKEKFARSGPSAACGRYM